MPDGRQLLFTTVTWPSGEPEGHVWRVSAEGGEAQKLEMDLDVLRGGVLRVHPDGRQLVFTSGQPFNLEMWVMENFLPERAGNK